MSQFSKIKEKFNILSPAQKNALLKDLYNFSKDTRFFLESRLLGGAYGTEFLRQMEKETLGKVYRKGMPDTPNGKNVNSIIEKARKSGIDVYVMLQLQKFAYRGFIEYLNEYGGGPENFDDMACRHLEHYLTLVKNKIDDPVERKEIFEDVKKYLLEKNNMITDTMDETYESVTGIPISRKL